jgi:2-keto-4-pentenoate hydratase/2-oxohepta-3-ene-1,7-dioic acid hydratase in catechol pathway
MKIICVGRNYANHAKELKNQIPSEPVLFMKPDTALLSPNKDFYLPNLNSAIHYECEMVVKISKMGKHIEPQFAANYYHEFTLGLDLTARDLQERLKEQRLPWEKAKAFDNSAFTGPWLKAADYDLENLEFSLLKNDDTVQKGNTHDMLFKLPQLISHISEYFTLKVGDLIFTGTPAGVGPLRVGDNLDLKIMNESLAKLSVK